MTSRIRSRLEGPLPTESPDAVAETIGTDESLAISGFGSVGYPKALPLSLASSSRDLSLTVVSGGSVGEEIDVELMEAGAIARRYPYQAQPVARRYVNNRQVAFNDRHIYPLGDEVALGQLVGSYTAVVEAVAVGDGWYVPSTSIGPTPSYVRGADRLIIELNRAQPLELQRLHDVVSRSPPPHREPLQLTGAIDRLGDPRVEFDSSKLDAVIETDRPDSPYTFRELTDEEHGIGRNLAAFLSQESRHNPLFDDVVHLQFGVGNIGNALMAELDQISFDGTRAVYFGEVIQDGLLDMIDEGILRKASATSLALSRDGQRQLFDDVDRYAESIVVRQSSVSNNPSLINRLGVVGINSAAEVDLYGNANSTHIGGTHVLNGIGGSGDFIRNSLLSIIALPSTAKDGSISRIVPMVPHVDHTEHDIQVVVTEQGVADLRGLAPHERAEELIHNCVHPDFVESLRSYYESAAESSGHIPHDLNRAFEMHTDS